MSTALSPTPRSTVGRHRERGATDRSALYDVLDHGLVCHLALVRDGAPVVLPTGYGRIGDTLYVHGSSGARWLREDGIPVCATVTHLDGIVYARSVFSFSMNYRSAVAHGTARLVTGEPERTDALRAIVEHLAPGSWDYARPPTRRELAATAVLALDLAEASVKVRTGPPADEPEDVSPEVWAGVVPLTGGFGAPVPDPHVPAGALAPPHVTAR
ncbi:pyridoxamine 5'-phosphate oxidase family protein [Pseudonocardia sp. RS11V-5]|uniref:pyridoxamine 5'-phosphate oxidase family protein n=1 Tax=Pseudonocardia terrae TaxID=2905831 RepID=UPI001E5C32AB|nr:pyridoxamine 5'-phosphate oxidase family protein [Pseudonocardia terrae]MCE3552315.1 pyridoxamine 5'-phosphate oxidase family protein [Pseudonocardia terrae]